MERNQARDLIRKYREGTLTEPERALLESWYLNVARSKNQTTAPDDLENRLDSIWQSLPVHQEPVEKRLPTARFFGTWISVAASILVICSLGIYWMYKPEKNRPMARRTAPSTEIAPGENRALLTLADGSSIVLNDAKTGELARQDNATIRKTKEGQIVLDLQRSSASTTPTNETSTRYNVLSTPRAGQYQVKLPDGTNVWLNAISTLRFPTVFSDAERRVEVTGEAYFEVAKQTRGNRKIPFRVVVGQQTIDVLGTSFNVNSYRDEDFVKTTLLEGRIQLRLPDAAAKNVVLRPGQQAQLRTTTSSSTQPFQIREVDAEGVVSWKNGYFRFDNTSLPELMRQIARWYDVEVEYAGPISEREFVGQIERSANLSKVLKILELGGVHFRMKGNTIVVTE